MRQQTKSWVLGELPAVGGAEGVLGAPTEGRVPHAGGRDGNRAVGGGAPRSGARGAAAQ